MFKGCSAKRPDGFSNDDEPFYLAPRTKEGCSSQWFLRQRLGKVKLGKMLKTMAVAANLPEGNVTQTTLRENILSRSCEAMLFLLQKLWLLLVIKMFSPS
ncbi:hypothetical protein DPMN_173842 [Dreissena polymorpha]|uniref:Uncharacterized protein n=1 Tax=Dreissena polymorpha TaxID=45954 RepID=A0A9D4E6B3_DREPO|nr:hypothetical protein DPMN_173842 [Dreissena polymorpha]